MHVGELEHQGKDNQKHAHEGNEKEDSLEDKVEHFRGLTPLFLVFPLVGGLQELAHFVLMEQLLRLKRNAY